LEIRRYGLGFRGGLAFQAGPGVVAIVKPAAIAAHLPHFGMSHLPLAASRLTITPAIPLHGEKIPLQLPLQFRWSPAPGNIP
jgi:hypothetical protein